MKYLAVSLFSFIAIIGMLAVIPVDNYPLLNMIAWSMVVLFAFNLIFAAIRDAG